MTIVIIALYFVLTFLLTIMGIEKQLVGFQVFLIGLFLTPIAALLYIYGRNKNTSQINYYHCSKCNYIYPVKMNNCPICEEQGIKVKLKKYHSPHKASEVIGILNVA